MEKAKAGGAGMKRAVIFRLNGRYYGYPACCIAEFITDLTKRDSASSETEYRKLQAARLRRHKDKPWEDDGFLPCKKCARIAARDFAKFVAENITPRRKHPQPYPQDEPTPRKRARTKKARKEVRKREISN